MIGDGCARLALRRAKLFLLLILLSFESYLYYFDIYAFVLCKPTGSSNNNFFTNVLSFQPNKIGVHITTEFQSLPYCIKFQWIDFVLALLWKVHLFSYIILICYFTYPLYYVCWYFVFLVVWYIMINYFQLLESLRLSTYFRNSLYIHTHLFCYFYCYHYYYVLKYITITHLKILFNFIYSSKMICVRYFLHYLLFSILICIRLLFSLLFITFLFKCFQ